MILHPAILSLLAGSVLISAMLVYSAFYGIRILKNWDLKSGSDLQLSLERRTYLISTLVVYAFAFQLISLFLFVYTADHIHRLFVGAMCAAGSLNVNGYGYPTIVLKILNFILAGLWLILNFTDNRAWDYPLIRKKYATLLLVTPLIVAETIVQGNYFLRMEPDIITSCCGTLFSVNSGSITSGIVALSRVPVTISFYSAMGLNLAAGLYFFRKGKGGYLFSALNLSAFVVSMAAMISVISVYFYELPTHHCPFCILQREYGFVGYPLYITLLWGTVSGLGVGVIMPFKRIASLVPIVPSVQRNLAVSTLVSHGLFMIVVAWGIFFSNLSLGGY